MDFARHFVVICLIAYALFQFYQVYSSFTLVFVDYRHYYSLNVKILTGINVIGMTLSSVLLIIGALKSKANLLLLALIYLIFKVGFFVWYLRAFYNITIGCDGVCDPQRLWVVYKHLAVFGKIKVYQIVNHRP